MKRLDSTLTPYGMFQAYKLGNFFKQEGYLRNSNIMLCCSFLERTQLTGLSILEAAGIQLPEKMKTGLMSMTQRAFLRYGAAVSGNFKSAQKFLTFSPLNEANEPENFNVFLQTKGASDPIVDPIVEQIVAGLQGSGGSKKYKRKTKKVRKNRKTKRVRKNRTRKY